jgi:hypothetical protein
MDTGQAALLAVHLLATAAMVGIIWFVQVVHYPLFASVGTDDFQEHQHRHQRLTSYVVGPFMGVELATAAWIALRPPPGVPAGLALAGVLLLLAIHLATLTCSVPTHGRLARGFDPAEHRFLVRTNWIRTVGWSLRGVLAVLFVMVALTGG